MIRDHFRFSQLGEHILMLALVGGFVAYLGGTVLAGVFLINDLASRFSPVRRPSTAEHRIANDRELG
jgi:hypothetical protein